MGNKITCDELLSLVDFLESAAQTVNLLDSGRAEKYAAKELLIAAAAHVRGAANQLSILEETK